MKLSKETIVTVLELLKDEQRLLNGALEVSKEEYESLNKNHERITAAIDEIEGQMVDSLIK